MCRERCRSLVCRTFLGCAKAQRQKFSKRREICLSLLLDAEVGVGPRPGLLPYKWVQFPSKVPDRPLP